jgi:hypothetical protein
MSTALAQSCIFVNTEVFLSWARGHMPVIPAFGRQKQEDYEFKASLGFKVRLSLSHTQK